jgi:hypothetical protein
MKPNFRNVLLGCLLALAGLATGPALANCSCTPAPPGWAQPATLAPTEATPRFPTQKIAPARPKMGWGQRLLAKWATRKVSKQLRDGNPRPVHWANIVSLSAAVLGQILVIVGSQLGTWLGLQVLGLLLVLAALVLGIYGIVKSGKNKDYSGEGLGIAGVAYSGLWLLSVALLIVAFVLVGW